MRLVILALLFVSPVAPADSAQSIEEVRVLLASIKAKSQELGKVQSALQQIETDRDRAVSPQSENFNPDNCAEYRGAFQVQKCVLHSVREMKKLSDETQ